MIIAWRVMAVLSWLATIAAIVVFNLDYGTDEFSPLIRMGYTMPFALASIILHFIAIVIWMINIHSSRCKKEN